MSYSSLSFDERFWSKVNKNTPNGCWEWTANRNNMGYGLFRPGGIAPKRLAHRISFEIKNGPIERGLCVLHRCDNPKCVNPGHLFLGTKKDNVADMIAKGRKVIGWNPNSKPPHKVGSAHGESKMTEDLVTLYRKQLAEGKSLRQLARETGLDRKTLMSMRDRVTWRHVP